MAILTMFCGLMVIVTCLDTVKAEHLNSEETEFGVHTTLGVLVLCIGAFQVKEGLRI
jgi:hypothetical protein